MRSRPRSRAWTGTGTPTARPVNCGRPSARSTGCRAAQVFAANGSNEVLQTLLLAYAGPGRHVVTFEPTYQLHGHIARLTGALVARGSERPDFTLDACRGVAGCSTPCGRP